MYGFPISEALAEAGAHVIIASRNLDACERAAASLRSDGHACSAEQYDQANENHSRSEGPPASSVQRNRHARQQFGREADASI